MIAVQHAFERHERTDWLGPIAVAVLGMASTFWLFLFAGAGAAGAFSTLIYPPHLSRAEVLSRAAALDADIVAAAGSAVVVHANSTLTRDAYRATGALFLLNANTAGLCGVSARGV